MRIVLCYPVEPKHIARIRSTCPEAEIVDAGQERVADELPEADVFCGHPKVPVPWDAAVRRGRLRWIQSSAAGLDHCLVPSVVQSSIMVTSASGVLSRQVADHALALLLGVLRNLPTFFRAQQQREFVRQPTRDLHGARIGLIGLGANGRRLAKVLKPFDVSLIATDWFPEQPCEFVHEVLPADAVEELLPAVDAVILTAPLTEHTRHMITRRRLQMLHRDAVLINVARGALIVEPELAEVLRTGHLWGAGLDVTENEPLPPISPLWTLPNVIITPHVGGQRASRIDDMTDLFCHNLGRYLAGQPLANLVDKRLGFPEPGVLYQAP